MNVELIEKILLTICVISAPTFFVMRLITDKFYSHGKQIPFWNAGIGVLSAFLLCASAISFVLLRIWK